MSLDLEFCSENFIWQVTFCVEDIFEFFVIVVVLSLDFEVWSENCVWQVTFCVEYSFEFV